MPDRQSLLAQRVAVTLAEFLRDFPDTTLGEVSRALIDAEADAAALFPRAQEAPTS